MAKFENSAKDMKEDAKGAKLFGAKPGIGKGKGKAPPFGKGKKP